MLAIVHHPDYQTALRPGHRFPMSKYGYLREALLARGLLGQGRYLAPAPAGLRTLELAHHPDYVRRAADLSLSPDEIRRLGLPSSENVIRRSRLSVSGTLLAGWLALEQGIACNSAGGSHHAGPGYGAGFCVFNDVAVAASALLSQGVAPPVLVVDADVHQGDGTARIFEDDARVFTFSIHAEKNFPARKARSDLDIALPDATADDAYLATLDRALEEVLDRVQPRLVFYNAGVDVHVDDKLGRLSLSTEGLRRREALVLGRVRARHIPVVGVVGGGYSDDPIELAGRHAILFEEAARLAA